MLLRIYTGDDGRSHFQELPIPTGPGDNSPFQPATGVSFRQSQPGYFNDWHNAPRRQYVITLSGQFEIGIGDGTVRRMGPGDVLLAEDVTGQGHTIKVVGNQTRVSVAIPLA